MNFLAHIWLSGPDTGLQVGNFLADFIGPQEQAALPQSVRRGVRMHHVIDRYTDDHPAVRHSVELLRPEHGRYAPVVLDVLLDYILIHNWDRYSDLPLRGFTSTVYEVLMGHRDLMPAMLRERWLPAMVADDWLMRYGTVEGLSETFRRMGRRCSKPWFLDGATASLGQHYADLEADFHRFFGELQTHLDTWRRENPCG
ncbi:MAG: hypothetical protein RLY31_122 [Bacteroidota bacterium]|jgi:acyl carrier protein phosphodiesterase